MDELITIVDGNALLDPNISLGLAEFERKAKEIKEAEDVLKQRILEEMESKGILKIDTPHLTISYIAPTDRESFDSKRFRTEHPDMFDEFVKMSPVKSSVRLKVKE